MLPHIHGEQGGLAVGQGEIGIRGFCYLQGAILQHQPGPAAAELGGSGGLELLHKRLKTAEIGIDLFGQGAAGAAAAAGLEALPVEAVIPHLGRVVEHPRLAGIAGHGQDRFLQALALQLRTRHQVVQVVDVGVVVLAMVELQRGAGDVRLKGIERVRQFGQLVSHGGCGGWGGGRPGWPGLAGLS